MSVTIREVAGRADRHAFAELPFELYRGDALWVPPLLRDELELFDPRRNPAFESAESRQFLAYRRERPLGRIAAILSHVANRKHRTLNMRFGWFESVDDPEVASALLGSVETWAQERGLETITGPHGFCDFDPQGLLIEGFDQLPTVATCYNRPYYARLVEACGFRKDIDYLEFRTPVPRATGTPERLLHLSERVRQRGGLHLIEFRNRRDLTRRAPELFRLLDEVFEDIYGAVPLSPGQVRYFTKRYFPFVDRRLVKAVANARGEMVGFLITLPSLSRGFQLARGRLLPFGWWHLLRALRRRETLDFYLGGVRPSCRGMGVDLLMAVEIIRTAMAMGFQHAESNPELETNHRVHAIWKGFDPVQHKRRRIYCKRIGEAGQDR